MIPIQNKNVPWTLLAWLLVCGLATGGGSSGLAIAEDAAIAKDDLAAAEDDLAAAGDVRQLQRHAMETGHVAWGHWGIDPRAYSRWTNHSNRLIPVYTFGMALRNVAGPESIYRRPDGLRALYGPKGPVSFNAEADYFDQTDVFRLQQEAVERGKRYIILVIFDGLDWQTTWATAVHKTQRIPYTTGRGSGLAFQDSDRVPTDFGLMVTSPHHPGAQTDVDGQQVISASGEASGGYDAHLGGATPWAPPPNAKYLLGQYRKMPHAVTDSAASATSMVSGVKTYNGAINVDPKGKQVTPIPRQLQAERDFAVGVVTSVPISHATPGACYANNVSRDDYQDITRDLLGLRNVAHRDQSLAGVDVLLGAGWGEIKAEDPKQGANFAPGNKYLTDSDLRRVDYDQGGKYRVAQRTPGSHGSRVLETATEQAVQQNTRLFGFFGTTYGHLPYRTADGDYRPTRGVNEMEVYSPADIDENPTLAEMTGSALRCLERHTPGFWLMVEAGDVDWASHSNNLDNTIGAVISGEEAFQVIMDWIERRDCWDETAVIVTADHGHYFCLEDPQALIDDVSVP